MKRKTVSQLKKALWRVFAPWIKERDDWTCVTCGKKVDSYECNVGHYIAKAACNLEYYFSEYNNHVQCTKCNLMLEGNRPAYRQFILDKYGTEVLQDLESNYGRTFQGDSQLFLEEKIEFYKNNRPRKDWYSKRTVEQG